MTTMRKPAAWLALLLSFLLAAPPAVLADDTELFTTSANPNVLLMLDTTGSMDTEASGDSVGDLDGDGTENTRMDILWKVIYGLLNADMSTLTVSGTTTTCKTLKARRWNSTTTDENIRTDKQYQYVEINSTGMNSTTWNKFPGSATTGGTVRIGSGGSIDNMTYTSRSESSPYRFYFSSAKTFAYAYSKGTTISYTSNPTSLPYPTDSTQAASTDFSANITKADEEILKARLGLMTFTTNSNATEIRINTRSQITTTSPNSPQYSPSYRNIWDNTVEYAKAEGGTPTAQALIKARDFFKTATNDNKNDVCRKNFAILVTDGEDTMGTGPSSSTVFGNGYGPYYYKSGSNYSNSYVSGYAFNADGYSGSYWDGTPWNSGQANRHNYVVNQAYQLSNPANDNTLPAVTLFAIGVGITDNTPDLRVQRDVLRRAAEQKDETAEAATYTSIGNAAADNTSRGADRAFFASSASEFTDALRKAFHSISAGTYSFTAPTVASVRLTDRNYLYKASFQPNAPPDTHWPGKLEALTVLDNGTISDNVIWEAGAKLQAKTAASRLIYTSDNTWKRQVFDNSYITPAMLTVDNNAARDNVVDYIRGLYHDNNMKLGDIFHSKPVVVGPPSTYYFDGGYSTAVGSTKSYAADKATRRRVLYVGTNDGMLHAFVSGDYNSSTSKYDSGTGEELFGYVPHALLSEVRYYLPDVNELSSHGYYVDSSPRVADVWLDNVTVDGIKQSSEWRTVLISGMRKGGRGYFALDVTDPSRLGTDDYPKVLWEFTDSSHLGESWSEPVIGKVKISKSAWSTSGYPVRDRWVAIFGGGWSGDNVANSLIVLDIATGTPLKVFTAGIDNNIVAPPTMLLDGNGYIKLAYVADLDGSVYKFDLHATGIDNASGGDNYFEWKMKKIFQASDDQPVYHRVEAGVITDSDRYLFFGTGNQEYPITDNGTGKFYAIRDSIGNNLPDNTVLESELTNLTGNLSGGATTPGSKGWYVDLSAIGSASGANVSDTTTHSGEKVLSDPVVYYNNVYFTTFTPSTSSDVCSGGGAARVYGINMYNAAGALDPMGDQKGTGGKDAAYYVYTGTEGGVPSSASLSIDLTGQGILYVGTSGSGTSGGTIKTITIDSPAYMKTIKSWKETF
jgi:Tfp pilus tip-associated adhesin PilY1